jgi:glycosyltransferase involved in cell wall biosynthesis/GT2 family glycosyltransferase
MQGLLGSILRRVAGRPLGMLSVLDEPGSGEAEGAPTVDIVVCVHNALPDVRRCLESVLRYLDHRSRLVVVNDGSDDPTSTYLRRLLERSPRDVLLIEHATNRGYTRAANTALRASTADYVILLNSDTVVTPGWVQRIVACGQSDPRIGIVGPLSNAASWQTVPVLLDDEGVFCINSLPEGHGVESLGALVAASSARAYPRVPFINGFCFAMKRTVVDQVGEFDSVSFPRGYGEENDYCLRASAAGFTLAVADDAYVFHSKSRSFGHQDRRRLSEAGKVAFVAKHGAAVVAPLVREIRSSRELREIRQRVIDALGQRRDERILFLLPVSGGGGGSHSVVQEAAAMRRLGVDAKVAIDRRFLERFRSAYRGIAGHDALFEPYVGDELLQIAGNYTIVVATIYKSVAVLRQIVLAHPTVLPAYYVQDYEPRFFEEGTAEYDEAFASYTLVPGALLFAKTRWLADTVRQHHGVHVAKVSPSLDHDVYKPGCSSAVPSASVRVCAMIRPRTPRRAAPRTMRVLTAVQERYGDLVSIQVFGCTDDDPGYAPLASLLDCRNHGVLDREGVAALLASSDIFVDLSDYQAFGRTGLEAMACGCAVINPLAGGAAEYTVHGENGLLVDTADEEACVEALARLVEDGELRRRLALEGQKTAARYTPQQAAESELAVLRARACALHEGRQEWPIRVRALPAMHDGRFTGSAFVRLLRPFRHRSLADEVLFECTTVSDFLDAPAHRLCDALLIQRDAAEDVPTARRIIDACRNRGIRVVYEVDDILLDSPALGSRTGLERAVRMRQVSAYLAERADAVVVSSKPLADRYRELNPHVSVVPNALDPDLWGLNEEGGVRRGSGGEGPVRIGFMGTFGHGADLDILTPALERLSREFGAAVSFELLGGRRGDSRPFRRIALPEDATYPSFVPWLRHHAKWDIGLISLVDDEFNRAKSYVKWLEYSALGAASVCSDVTPYRAVVRNGENGLVVQNTAEDWYAALKRLIEDPALRERLARQALADVREHHTLAQTSRSYVEVLRALWDHPNQRASQFAAPAVGDERPDVLSWSSLRMPAFVAESPHYQRFRRRADKLRRDPDKFMADSRFGILRRLGRMGLFT